MKKDKEFNNILDECLERLLAKGETIEQCLSSHPEQAAELEPLLQTAMLTKKALAIQPNPDFEAKARYQFHAALQEATPERGGGLMGWQPAWAIVLAIVLVVLLAGSGAVATSGSSMPDNPLYTVKLATEQVRLTLTRSIIDKTELYAKLADRRVTEIIYIANKNKPKKIEQLAQRLSENMLMMAGLPPDGESGGVLRAPAPAPAPAPAAPLQPQEAFVKDLPPPSEAQAPALLKPTEESEKEVMAQPNQQAKLRVLLEQYAVDHPEKLRAVLQTAPESAKPALRRAIDISVAGYKKALEDLE